VVSEIDAVLVANERYSAEVHRRDVPVRPARHLVVVTCMDSRIDTFAALGLDLGDAHILRNAGGRVTDDVLRSLALSTTLLGTSEVIVIHHTQCGLSMMSDVEVRAACAAVGVDAEGIDFMTFTDVEASVREDVDRLRTSPLVAHRITVSGWVFDVQTGALRGVVAPAPASVPGRA
jgi:carbonic anhydrase